MARFTFKLPDVGEGTAEAEIAQWRVQLGDHVREDDPLVDVLTDKATVELTSPVDGVIVEMAGEAGSMVPVGSALVVIETSAADAIGATPAAQGDGPAVAEADAAVTEIEPHAIIHARPPAAPEPEPVGRGSTEQPPASAAHRPHAPATSAAGPVLAAPAVRARAKALGVDLAQVQPGPHGRVRHQELDAFLAYEGRGAADGGGALAAPALTRREGSDTQKMIGLRRKIAEKMAQSARSIPHFAYVEEVDCTELESLRQHLNTRFGEARGKLTLLPFLIRAMTRALPDFPQVNARYDEDAGVIERFAPVHMGVAAQTPSGLMVPVVMNAEARSLWDLSAEIVRLSNAARAGKAAARELSGSTITITSLGPLGGIVTTPVINHPEVAIVGVGKLQERAVIAHGHVTVRRMMNLSSSFDHRVVDGYDAAQFIQAVKALIEHPAMLFIDE